MTLKNPAHTTFFKIWFFGGRANGLGLFQRPSSAGVHNYQPGKPIEEVERVRIAGPWRRTRILWAHLKAVTAIKKHLRIFTVIQTARFYLETGLRFHNVSQDQIVLKRSDSASFCRARICDEDEVIIANRRS